jgi:hypothetical protein
MIESPTNGNTDALLTAYHRLRPSPEGLVIIDVGANKGFETLEYLSLWGHQWRYHAAQLLPSICAAGGMLSRFCTPSPLRVMYL